MVQVLLQKACPPEVADRCQFVHVSEDGRDATFSANFPRATRVPREWLPVSAACETVVFSSKVPEAMLLSAMLAPDGTEGACVVRSAPQEYMVTRESESVEETIRSFKRARFECLSPSPDFSATHDGFTLVPGPDARVAVVRDSQGGVLIEGRWRAEPPGQEAGQPVDLEVCPDVLDSGQHETPEKRARLGSEEPRRALSIAGRDHSLPCGHPFALLCGTWRVRTPPQGH